MLRYTSRLLKTGRAKPARKAVASRAKRSEVQLAEADAHDSVDVQSASPVVDATTPSDITRTSTTTLPAYHPTGKARSPFDVAPQRSVLKNGLTVITRDSVDNVDHFGVFLKAGPAYLTTLERGYAQMLAYALLHTNKVSSTFAIIKAFAANQSVSQSRIVGRQLVGITADGLVEDPAYLFETFTNALFMPCFQRWEIKESLEWYEDHYLKVLLKETPHLHIEDLVFKAAFGTGALAEPVLLPQHVLRDGVNVDTLVALWQRVANLDSMAVVGSSTWTHAAVVERLQQNEDIQRNEGSSGEVEQGRSSFNGGTVVDFKSRKGYAYEHGSAAAFGGLGFDAAGEDDAKAAAATRVLAQHPKFRSMRGVHHHSAQSGYTGFQGQGLLHFVTSAGDVGGIRDVHASIQDVLSDVAAGRGVSQISSMQLAAANQSHPRQSAVDLMALQWASGAKRPASVMDVTADDVVAAAKRAVAKPPAVVYHGDAADVARESLVV